MFKRVGRVVDLLEIVEVILDTDLVELLLHHWLFGKQILTGLVHE